MKSNGNQYINSVFRFEFYNANYFGLCVACGDDGKLICYRVKEKTVPKFQGEVIVENANGDSTGYVVDYRCKFRIPAGCARKLVLRCEIAYVEKINNFYRSMPPLEELLKKYKELKEQYYRAPGNGTKSVRHQMNDLAHEINARKAVFLQNEPSQKKPSNKYANFKQTPDKNGISRVYSGGSCSSK